MADRRGNSSVPGFILVAIILIALLVCGAYFVQQQRRHKPVTTPLPVAELPGGDQKPAEESTMPPANNAPNNSATQSSSQSTGHLPQSGPTDGLMMGIMAGLLVGAGVSYIQSRRRLAPL